jgi:hypothetical protein
MPTTRGIETCAGTPVEIWTDTIVPSAVTEPPPGDWLKTFPFGLRESATVMEKRNPASERVAIASCLLIPITLGTGPSGGFGGSGKPIAGSPCMTFDMYDTQIGAATVPPKTLPIE